MGLRKTRFLISGAVALLAAGCSSLHKPGAVRIDPALETLVPSDTVFLLGARIDKIRDTDIYRKYLSQTNPTQIQQFAQATGIDPRKDLDEALACYNGKAGLLLIRGAFNKRTSNGDSNRAARSPWPTRASICSVTSATRSR